MKRFTTTHLGLEVRPDTWLRLKQENSFKLKLKFVLTFVAVSDP